MTFMSLSEVSDDLETVIALCCQWLLKHSYLNCLPASRIDG